MVEALTEKELAMANFRVMSERLINIRLTSESMKKKIRSIDMDILDLENRINKLALEKASEKEGNE